MNDFTKYLTPCRLYFKPSFSDEEVGFSDNSINDYNKYFNSVNDCTKYLTPRWFYFSRVSEIKWLVFPIFLIMIFY